MQTSIHSQPSLSSTHPAPASARSRLLPTAALCLIAGFLLAGCLGRRAERAVATPDAAATETAPNPCPTLNLTPRQRTVARLILDHYDYSDIGRECGVSLRTVQDDASHIFHEAAVKGRRDFERLMAREAQPAAAPRESAR